MHRLLVFIAMQYVEIIWCVCVNTFISGLICCTASSEHTSVQFCFALVDTSFSS